MLSPSNRVVFLQQDKEIMDITGMSEAEYRWFVRECVNKAKVRPGEPVALGFLASVAINLVIGVLLTAAATLLAPKPKDNESKGAEEETIEGQDIVRRDRFTPKSGFDSFQNVVDMGSVVPIVYCKREDIDGKAYGGLRVNTNLLWSQILSVGGGQFFRGLFLVGEGPVELDYAQLALGNNTLASYELPPATDDAEAGRATVYYAPTGGRPSQDDRVLGVISANDPGAQVGSPTDIYEVVGTTDFCQALQPSNQTEFGLYDHIGNNFGYKIGEDFLALTQWQGNSEGDFERQGSNQKIAQGSKNSVTFTTRAGVLGGSNKLYPASVGEVMEYVILMTDEYDREFIHEESKSGGEQPSVVNNHDVATTIASIQRTFDERISIGDVYRLGSAVVICIDRGDAFVSNVDYDGEGTEVRAKFRVMEAGSFHLWDGNTLNFDYETVLDDDGNPEVRTSVGTICSEYSQMFRMLTGAFSVERAFKVVEVGLQSNVGLKSSGITNFNSLVAREYYQAGGLPSVEDGSYLSYVSAEFCGGQENEENSQSEAYRKEIIAGTYSGSDTRYSFFRIFVKDIDSPSFTRSNDIYAVRSVTGVNVYNYLRFTFDESKRREFKFVPLSSWEIRKGQADGGIYALDPHSKNEYTRTENGYTLSFIGLHIDSPNEEFGLKAFKNPNPAPLPDDETSADVALGFANEDDSELGSYVDGWARAAEAFIYAEVTTTATQPEHRISYVNIISENVSTPIYDDMAVLGLNINSSKELRNLDQLSVYCTEGVIPYHTFPKVFEDLLTNKRYGVGEFFSPEQIDSDSFEAAHEWTTARKYFYDGAVSEKLNLRGWGAERARDFLLDLSVSGGRYTLKPVVNFDGPEPIAAMFSSGNIINDTLAVNYLDTQDRLDPIVTVRWREERANNSVKDKGLFPQIREFSVRRAGVNENAPVIQVDLSNFCTNRTHAEDRAKLECQSKHYITHAVSFKTTPTEAGVQAGSIIKLGIETIYYEQPQNGAISNTGEVTSWPPLSDGKYDAIIWDGKTLKENASLSVKNGKALNYKNSVFCIADSTSRSDTYKVTAISFDEDGNVDIEALYWPTDAKGVSLMTLDWYEDATWDIDG